MLSMPQDDYLKHQIAGGGLKLPAGASYAFAGSYENQVRSEQTLGIVIPVALMLIFTVLYLQFRSVPTSLNVFSGIFVAWSGGFIMLWLYAQPWFLDFNVFGVGMRALFQVQPYNLSVAVWVGFLALFGIATNDGVIYSTYLDQVFAKHSFTSIKEIREATVEAGLKRVRPALMTTATTILALIPVLTSQGKGAEVMVPMALPSFGGMSIDIITILLSPLSTVSSRRWSLREKQHGLHDERSIHMVASIRKITCLLALCALTLTAWATPVLADAVDLPDGSKLDSAAICPVCKMKVGAGNLGPAAVVFNDGKVVNLDGAGDFFRYLLSPSQYGFNPSNIKAVFVTEYGTKKFIDAKSAFYVFGRRCDRRHGAGGHTVFKERGCREVQGGT